MLRIGFPALKRTSEMWSGRATFAAAVCGASAIAILSSGSVYAQSAVAPEKADVNSLQLEKIVVTAQRKAENLQDVPISVTAFTGANLTQRAFVDPSQLQYLAPSLLSTGNSGVAQGINSYYIRGIGTQSFVPSIEYDVATSVDDVVFSRPELGISQLFDLDRVEVLSGPQGTLFGRNASAGLINEYTNKPTLNRLSGFVHAEAGSINTENSGYEGQLQGVLNVPITENSALRVSAFGNYISPLVKRLVSAPGQDLYALEGGGRIRYRLTAGDQWDVIVSADYTKENGSGSAVYPFAYILPTSVIARSLGSAGIVAGPNNDEVAFGGPQSTDFHVGGVQVNATYTTSGGYTISNITAARFFSLSAIADIDQSPVNYFDNTTARETETQYSEELRLTSPQNQKLTYQTGIYLFAGRYAKTNIVLEDKGLPPPAAPFTALTGGSSESIENTKSAAVYGEATYHVLPSLRLTAGGRETFDGNRMSSIGATRGVQIPLYGQSTLTDHFNNSNFSYRLGVQYDVAPTVMAYYTFTRGYKAGGFNNATQVAQLAARITQEIPIANEIGFKSTWLDRRLLFNFDLFHETFHGYQSLARSPVFGSYVDNVGRVISKGAEAQLSVKPVAGLTLTSSLAFTDAHYTSFVNASCAAVQPGCVGGFKNVSGSFLANASKWVSTNSAQYEQALGRSLTGFASVDYYYRSAYNFTPLSDPHTQVPGYGLLGARVGVYNDNGLRVTVFVRNLTDHRFPNFLAIDSFGDYYQSRSLNAFRTVGASLDYTF